MGEECGLVDGEDFGSSLKWMRLALGTDATDGGITVDGWEVWGDRV